MALTSIQMKFKYLIIISFLFFGNVSAETVTISENASSNIKLLGASLKDLERQNELKEIIFSYIELSNKLSTNEAQKLLNSEYFLDAKRELKVIIAKNKKSLNDTGSNM